MDEYICKNELDKIDDYPPPFKKVLECTTMFDDVFVGHIIVDGLTITILSEMQYEIINGETDHCTEHFLDTIYGIMKPNDILTFDNFDKQYTTNDWINDYFVESLLSELEDHLHHNDCKMFFINKIGHPICIYNQYSIYYKIDTDDQFDLQTVELGTCKSLQELYEFIINYIQPNNVITFDNSDEKYTKDDFVEVLTKPAIRTSE